MGPQFAHPARTILLAEDECRLRSVLAAALRMPGNRVIDAADGCEALRKAQVHGPDIDLLLSDVEMPIVGGIELAQRLQGERPGLKVLLMSGSDASAAAAKNGWAFLAKPFGIVALNEKVAALLGITA